MRQDLKAVALLVFGALFLLGGAAPAGAAYQCQGNPQPLKDAVCIDPNTDPRIVEKPGSGNLTDLADEQILVPLDNTGIQSWRFLNPRNPFPLVRPVPDDATVTPGCISAALRCTKVEFRNQTLDREFDVTFKFTLAVPQMGNLGLIAKIADLERRLGGQQDLLANRERLRTEIFQQIPPGVQGTSAAQEVRSMQISPDPEGYKAALQILADETKKTALDPSQTTRLLQTIQAALENEEDIATSQYMEQLSKAMTYASQTPAEQNLSTLTSGEKQVGSDLQECRANLDRFVKDGELEKIELLLKNQTPDQRENHLAACTNFVGFLKKLNAATLSDEVGGFDSGVQNLRLLLRLPDIQNICKPKRGERTLDCSFRLGVPADTSLPLPSEIVALLPPNETIEFPVSLQQEEDDGFLTNRIGYFATAPKGREPDNKTTWTASTSVGYDYKPTKPKEEDLVVDGVAQKVILPYDGERTSTSSAVGRLAFSANLGDRARGDVTLAYKKGVLGDGSDGTMKAELYTFSMFAKSGLTLRVGRYEIAAPASGIAVSETGEGAELVMGSGRSGNYSIGYLARRESADPINIGKPDPKGNNADLDSDLYIGQVKGFPISEGFFRSANLLALWGEDENDASDAKPEVDSRSLFLKQPHKYWTVGGEVFFALPPRFSGSLAHFRSKLDREGKLENPEPDGSGNATLLTLGWANVKNVSGTKTTLRKFAIVSGMGSGNDPKTKEFDGYLGENASGFTGNTFLLTHLAGNIPNVDKGMVNKTFAGLVITDNAEWARALSPLRAGVRLLNTQDQIIAESFVLRIYGFRFNEPVLGEHEASLEGTAEFSIQVPKGVTTTLKLGYLVPGPALKTLFNEDPWFASIQFKLDIK